MINLIAILKALPTIGALAFLLIPQPIDIRSIEGSISTLFAGAVSFSDSATAFAILSNPIAVSFIDLIFIGGAVFLLTLEMAKLANTTIGGSLGIGRDMDRVKLIYRLNLAAFRALLQTFLEKAIAFNTFGVSEFSPALFATGAIPISMRSVLVKCAKGENLFTFGALFHHDTSASVSAKSGRKPVQIRVFGPSPYSPTQILA